MKAAVGDRIIIEAHHVGDARRDAEILDLRTKDGAPPYYVRWSEDGHEGWIFPGTDAHVEHFAHPGRKRQAKPRR